MKENISRIFALRDFNYGNGPLLIFEPDISGRVIAILHS
jgi:hypothetical protein